MLPDINNPDIYITEDVDAYEDSADDLMDDLFGEVEHILSVESTPSRAIVSTKPTKPAAVDVRPPQLLPSDTVSITKLDLPALAIPPISHQDILWLDRQVASGSELVLSDMKPIQGEPQRSPSRLIERGLTIAACMSVIFAASLWTFKYGLVSDSAPKTVAISVPATQPETDTAEFAEEVKQSFTAIANKEKEKSTTANSTQLAPNLPNPLLPLAGQIPGLVSNPQFAGAVQPIYVPVYQPPTPGNPAGLRPANTTANPAIAPNSPAPAPAIASPPPAPVASAPSTILVGIMDIGDQSSAMFDINGSVQSVRVGSQIAGSGWVLNRITQQEAILKRGNETKSIFVGQKF
jgi:hypothetical protein